MKIKSEIKNFFKWASFSVGIITSITACILFHENLNSQGYTCLILTVIFFFLATGFNRNNNNKDKE